MSYVIVKGEFVLSVHVVFICIYLQLQAAAAFGASSLSRNQDSNEEEDVFFVYLREIW